MMLTGMVLVAGGLQGIQVFFPAIAVDLGVWPNEVDAAISFGGGIVLGAIVGGVCHGFAATKAASYFSVAGRGDSSEARVLMLLFASTAALGACGSFAMDYAIVLKNPWAVTVLVMLVGALLLGSLGLQIRTPLLMTTSDEC